MHYFKKHWSGQQSIGIALVLNFLIPLGILSTMLPKLVSLVFGFGDAYRLWLGLLLVICFAALFVWQCFGLLRTGELKTRETGERLWSTGSQILIVSSMLFVMVSSVGVFQQVTALAKAEQQQGFSFVRNYRFVLNQLEDVVEVSGDLDPGVTRELTALLDSTPTVKTVELHSRGGQIYEGRGLHQLIQRRGLNTLVTKTCLSACTMAFLGGVERRIGVTGAIGFHQYRTYSIQPNINVAKEQARDEKLMLLQSVSPKFVQRVFTTSPDDIWLPDRRALFVAGVVNIDPDD